MSGIVLRNLTTGENSPFIFTSTEKLVLLAIADYMRGNQTAWPSHRELGRWCSLSPSAVKKTTSKLCGPTGPLTRTLRPGRHGDHYEYAIREGVSTGPGHHVTQSPHVLTGSRQVRDRVTSSHVNIQEASKKREQPEDRTQKTSVPWLDAARFIWSERIGTPPQWFENDLRPLVGPTRTSEAVLAALRAYVEATEPTDASTRKFATKIGAWVRPRASEPETYRATPEQLAEKSRRYLEAEVSS